MIRSNVKPGAGWSVNKALTIFYFYHTLNVGSFNLIFEI